MARQVMIDDKYIFFGARNVGGDDLVRLF